LELYTHTKRYKSGGVGLSHPPFLVTIFMGDIGWDPNFEMGDGGIRIIRGYILVYFIKPPIEKLGKSNGRTHKNYLKNN